MATLEQKKCKIIFVGPTNAGKTSFVKRLAQNTFSDKQQTTIVCCFETKSILVENQKLILELWDTAGQERFQVNMSQLYYRGAHGMFLTFDISSEKSFKEMQQRYDQMKQEIKNMNENKQCVVIGCKCDLESERQVSYQDALAFAQNQGMHFFETSAKTGTNCQEAAEYIAREILKHIKSEDFNIRIKAQQQKPQQYPCC